MGDVALNVLDLPLFDDAHREHAASVEQLCSRLAHLSGMELEDSASASVEYIALLGQEGLFDAALGRALEGEAPRPDLRSLCLTRENLGRTSGLCDGAYGAHVQGMYPIALAGNEDQRAIYLPGMAAGQTVATLALLDGKNATTAMRTNDGTYLLQGQKHMVPLAPVADQIVVLVRLATEKTPKFSLLVVPARAVKIESEEFVSPMPVGKIDFDGVEVDADERLGGDGQGLVIAQASLDILRLPTASACVGLAAQALEQGTKRLLARGVQGRSLKEQQGCQWQLADALAQVEAARALISQAAYKRDTASGREVMATTVARQIAQDAAETACRTISDLSGVRGLGGGEAWTRLLAEAKALRLETEFLENARTVIAQALLSKVGKNDAT